MASLDFRKAFDTVWLDWLMQAIWKTGIRGRIWKIIDSFYDDVKAKDEISDIETDFLMLMKESNKVAVYPQSYFVFLFMNLRNWLSLRI